MGHIRWNCNITLRFSSIANRSFPLSFYRTFFNFEWIDVVTLPLAHMCLVVRGATVAFVF